MIPWNQIAGVKEMGLSDMPMFMKTNIGLGSLCEIRVKDPGVIIYTQKEAANDLLRVANSRGNR
jgi:hypothetical protein